MKTLGIVKAVKKYGDLFFLGLENKKVKNAYIADSISQELRESTKTTIAMKMGKVSSKYSQNCYATPKSNKEEL